VLRARNISCFFLLLAVLPVEARVGFSPVYDPPSGYYAAAQGLVGAGLKSALHQAINDHRVLSYGSSGTVRALRVLDAMPGDPTKVRLLYWGTGRNGSDYGGNNGDWNHEHCWPQAYGVGSGPGNSDVHNLRPTDVQANNERASLFYAEITGGSIPTFSPLCRKTSTQWMPRPEEKGDLARAMFYMAVRYEGGESTPDLELSDSPSSSANRFGRLSDLLRWHREDPVNDEERRRNHLVYTDYQYNRNPFVDDPDYAEMVFRGVPVVRATVVQPTATEGITAAVVRISRRGPVQSALTVALTYGGTAGLAAWQAAPGTVTIPAGAASFDLVLNPRTQAGQQGVRSFSVAVATNAAYAPVDPPAEVALLDAPGKIVPQIVTWPVAEVASEGTPLAEIALDGGAASVPGGFAFANGQIVPPVGDSLQQVVFTPADTTTYEKVTLVVGVRVEATPTGFEVWSGGQEPTPASVRSYAIGGASSPAAADGTAPVLAHTADALSVTAVVRTNDPSVTVTGEAVGDMADYADPARVVTVHGSGQGIDQSDVPAGFERRVFRVGTDGADQAFLRLRAVLAD